MGGAGENSLRQRLSKGRLCVIHSGQVYDVTDFSDRHPGGKAWLEKYAGQDVTQVMESQSPHKHTRAAYSIMQKYRVAEASDIGHKQNGSAESYHNKQFYSMDNDPLIDWSKPIMGQISGLRENYYKWVHEPVDTSLRLFQSDFVEFFSKCPWYMVPIVWVPITLFILFRCYTTLAAPSRDPIVWNLFGSEVMVTSMFMWPLVLLGLMLWTFCEYTIHRWLFHMKPPAHIPILVLLHFILHGQHHKSPMDRMRLVFPTIPATIFATLIFGLYYLLAPVAVAQALFSGTLIGYMVYDLTHYYIHHGTPMTNYFRSLKRYHVKHHFEQQNLGFGISSKLWDYPFGTLIPNND
ncbi:fatty acid 2-hydroxylase-like [Babylonia areolata]|uniref:fatty acid 2-hydroxylase-like n=1 Tax=Babylonia areolata TaxID=304850 RepID=UPI003FD28215